MLRENICNGIINCKNAKSWERAQILKFPKQPTNYDILSCLQKYDCGTFEDFCSDFGHDLDSRKAENIYQEVKEEYSNVQKIWTDEEIEELREIN